MGHLNPWFHSSQFSPVPWLIGLLIGREGQFSRDPLPDFSAGGPCEQFWRWQGCPHFDVVHPTFPLPITVSPTLQGALKNKFGEAVMACNMSETCKFPSLDSWQKRLPCEPTRKLILLCTQLLVSCSKCSLFYLLSQTCFKRASSFKLQCSNNW